METSVSLFCAWLRIDNGGLALISLSFTGFFNRLMATWSILKDNTSNES